MSGLISASLGFLLTWLSHAAIDYSLLILHSQHDLLLQAETIMGKSSRVTANEWRSHKVGYNRRVQEPSDFTSTWSSTGYSDDRHPLCGPTISSTPVMDEFVQDAKRHAHLLIDEHMRRVLNPRTTSAEVVASAKGMQIYTENPMCPANPQSSAQRMKRYVARFDLPGTIEELATLLALHPGTSATTETWQDVLMPEIVDRATLWQPQQAESATFTAIEWLVHEKPNLLTRARDYIVLERQHRFLTKEWQQGFVYLLHSVDSPSLDELVTSKRRYTRANMHLSGLVATQVDRTTGGPTLKLSLTLDVDFGGSISTQQHRNAVLQRLKRWTALGDLLWNTRILRRGIGWLLAAPLTQRLNPQSLARNCQVCLLRRPGHIPNKPSKNQNHSPLCQRCMVVVCLECSQRCEFPSFLVHDAAVGDEASLLVTTESIPTSATLCAVCINEHSRALRPQEP